KNRFETYVKSKDLYLWHIILNGDFPPLAKNKVTQILEVVLSEEQSDDLKKKLAKNNKAKMVLYNALPKKEYGRIFMCKTVKDIWQSLLITHQEESINSGFAGFNTIITSPKALDEGFSSKNYVRKFYRALHPKRRAKVTEIEELKDLSSLALDELIGNLKVHEVVMKKDFEIYKGKKERIKSIALKAKKESSDDETLTSESYAEVYVMAVRNFKKFLKERVNLFGNQEKKGSHSDKGMKRKERVTGNVLDAMNQVISLAIFQKHLATKIKRLSLEVLGAIARMTPKTKPTTTHVSWLNHQMSDKASTSGNKTMSFVGSSAEKVTNGSTIKGHGSTLPGSVSRKDSEKGTEHGFSPPMYSSSDFVITRKKPIHNSSDESKKPSLIPSLKSGIDEWIKDGGCSKHMIGNKSLFFIYKAYDREHVDNLAFNLLSDVKFVTISVKYYSLKMVVKQLKMKFGLEDSKPTKTPISMEIKLTKDNEADYMDSSKYRGKRKHEEMKIFIKEFKTTNKLLLKERSYLFSELKIKVNEFSKVMGNVLIPKNEVKGVTTRGGKMTSEATPSKEINETTINMNEPLRYEQDVQEKPHDDGVENKSLSIPERTTQPMVKPQQSSIPFLNRSTKEKEEAQQWKFLENLKQLHINILFIEALVQMPKYAKYLKSLLTNKSILEEACMMTMNERCSTVDCVVV
nr:zf-CCHC domain-containing protein/UBN2 domain-containing protein [Tanacetum cinerariifolium]